MDCVICEGEYGGWVEWVCFWIEWLVLLVLWNKIELLVLVCSCFCFCSFIGGVFCIVWILFNCFISVFFFLCIWWFLIVCFKWIDCSLFWRSLFFKLFEWWILVMWLEKYEGGFLLKMDRLFFCLIDIIV